MRERERERERGRGREGRREGGGGILPPISPAHAPKSHRGWKREPEGEGGKEVQPTHSTYRRHSTHPQREGGGADWVRLLHRRSWGFEPDRLSVRICAGLALREAQREGEL